MSSLGASAYTAGRVGAELLDELERRDGPLRRAQEYLALLEADPAADEFTIVVARNAVLQHRLSLVKAVTGES